VKPLALTPDGTRLLALNTPDARLEIFSVDAGGLAHLASVPVGLEPVAVAARTDGEAWVVNHLSDSVSIVDLAASPPRVVRTLLVGDEPRDVVFAGPAAGDGGFRRAFVTTARLGQNLPASIPMALTTPGVPRALVWVFDATDLGSALGGTPETVLELFGDMPRPLAASADGRVVYAGIFQSGNQTATVTEGAVCDSGVVAGPCNIDGVQMPGGLPGGQAPGGLPAPNINLEGVLAPEVGLIVRRNPMSGVWEDEVGRNWNNAIRFDLPDYDVFRIDALADPPRQEVALPHVGTILYNMVVHPATGRVYVSNTEARNEVRFEGHGRFSTSLRGHLHEARITVIDGSAVSPRHLNKHIAALPHGYHTEPMPPEVKEASLSMPVDLALASDGSLYVAAFGSSKVGVFAAAEIDDDTFQPGPEQHIEVSGGGPSGLALDEANQRLYVLTRFDNAVKVIDLETRAEMAQHRLFNPEPPKVVDGRRFLYDARDTSSNGEASCGVCHVFADMDNLAWDLGDPVELVRPNPNMVGPTAGNAPFHPMKGPMTTQTLRGMALQGPMHWRGDRTGGTFLSDPRGGDERLAYEAFNLAFDPLNGRDEGEIAAADMAAFTDFALELKPPPNPVRALDNSLNASQANGRRIFRDRAILTDQAASCRGCHTLNAANGNFGTIGATTFADQSQEFKVPQLKNMYQKVGMFGTPITHFTLGLPEHAAPQGEQVRGFGFLHDGSVATVFDFLRTRTFTINDSDRADIEQFVLAFETDFAPIVGQQVTLTGDNADAVGARIDLLVARARTDFDMFGRPNAKECELVARAVVDGESRGYLLDPAAGDFRSDREGDAALSDTALRALATVEGQSVTYLCAPPGEGVRLALDRDLDGRFDRDEIDAGTDPTDPDVPVTRTPTPIPSPTRTATPDDCPSDCNHDGLVTKDELAGNVSIGLGLRSLDYCRRLDRDRDRRLDVTDAVFAVRQRLFECPLD